MEVGGRLPRAGQPVGPSPDPKTRDPGVHSKGARGGGGGAETQLKQTITVSRCQSDISNQCPIRRPCITGMAEKSFPPLAGW